jgi:hypothetical protein
MGSSQSGLPSFERGTAMNEKTVDQVTYDAENKIRELRKIWFDFPEIPVDQTFYHLVADQINHLGGLVRLARVHQ